jgi:hypothetical protein
MWQSELASRLTLSTEHLLVWKAAQGIDDGGDLDVAASESVWPIAERTFCTWAVDQGLSAIIVCDHVVGVRILVGCGGVAGPRLFQLDLVDRKVVHGVPVWTALHLAAGATLMRGIRQLQPGAEGVARVLANRRDEMGLALVAADPAGAEALSRVLRLRGRLATRDGRFQRALLELTLAFSALASPRMVARARATDGARRACPVLHGLRSNRTLPDPLPDWLVTVSEGHKVITLA